MAPFRESTIVTAAAQPSPLPKSNASAWLLASIQVDTFLDHLPINRQETRYARLGVHLPRATLCEWKLASAELLATLLRGARAAATMYSSLGTCRLNGIEPYGWLREALERLPAHPISQIHELLPLAR